MRHESSKATERSSLSKLCTLCGDQIRVGRNGAEFCGCGVIEADTPVCDHGPFLVVSRANSSAPHAQCAGCGQIDRTGDWANLIGEQ